MDNEVNDVDSPEKKLANVKYMIEHQRWNLEVFQLSYEPCLQHCQQFMKPKKVFSANELNCVYNCIKKNQLALDLLLPRAHEIAQKGFI